MGVCLGLKVTEAGENAAEKKHPAICIPNNSSLKQEDARGDSLYKVVI